MVFVKENSTPNDVRKNRYIDKEREAELKLTQESNMRESYYVFCLSIKNVDIYFEATPESEEIETKNEKKKYNRIWNIKKLKIPKEKKIDIFFIKEMIHESLSCYKTPNIYETKTNFDNAIIVGAEQ